MNNALQYAELLTDSATDDKLDGLDEQGNDTSIPTGDRFDW